MKQKKLSSGKDHLEKIGRALIPRPWKEDLKSYSRTAGYDEVPYGLFGFVFYLSLMLSIALLRYQQEKVLAYVQGYGTFLSIIVRTLVRTYPILDFSLRSKNIIPVIFYYFCYHTSK